MATTLSKCFVSLAESDRGSLPLCPRCLRKLRWNRSLDTLERYRKLLVFYREHGLAGEADWTAERIRLIEAVE